MAGQPLQYFQMWSLVRQNYNGDLCNDPKFMELVSHELLMAIFWEETQFANIRQFGFDHGDWLRRWSTKPSTDQGNHAIGFGQVERDTLATAVLSNKLNGLIPGPPGTKVNMLGLDTTVLENDGLSVQLTWRVLWHLHTSGIKTKLGLVTVYGGHPGSVVPAAWLVCERAQIAYQNLGPVNLAGNNMERNMRLMAGAFWIARHDGAFPRAFGVTRQDAEKVGVPLRNIVAKHSSATNPNLIAQLRQFVVTI